MLCELFLQALAQSGRTLDQVVAQRAEELRKLLCRPVEHIGGKQAAARAEFHDLERLGLALVANQHTPHFFKLAGEQAAKNSVDVARGVEVSRLAELLLGAGVIAE